MRRMNITAKIWLSVGVFALGFVLSISLGQVQGTLTERELGVTSSALFPAAQKSQQAESEFERMLKGFGDAVITQDKDGLARAADGGSLAVQGLKAVAAIPGLDPQRASEAQKLAGDVQQLLDDARETYTAVLANPENMAKLQDKIRGIAGRNDEIKANLSKAKAQFSQDLDQKLSAVQRRSAQQRWIALVVFGVTILVAAAIVHITIRRSITGPVLRVIHGVQEAADGAAEASNQMSESGAVVARDAQEQAACVEETSASLAEMSATTMENATRAGEADRLMQEATKTVQEAAQAMEGLTNSMNLISKSSSQVAAVLKSIDEIAFHTNILALNAAVEAARAGEAGAGFSVVADEVRSLAHRAAEAARNSGDIIERTMADVNKGVELATVAHGAFSQVTTKIEGGSKVMSQIAASSDEQARGITNIGQAIHRIELLTQNNAANAHKTAEAAAAMGTQVTATRKHIDELVAVVGQDG
ncbi:MAG TPA: methyl-accepting chemotaxis protein [Bryobacteraceae bacterium]|nr:methyl-accepting chemotaxis protein [Bryobacteraceae bacterium]